MGCGGSVNKGQSQVGVAGDQQAPGAVGAQQPQGQAGVQAGGSTAPGVRQATPIIVEDVNQGGAANAGAAAAGPAHGSPPAAASAQPAAGSAGRGGDPAGQAPATCSAPGCTKPASGFSAYCSLECMDGLTVAPKAPPPIDPKIDAVVFRDPRSQFGDSLGVIGFYFPDREEDCDKICGAGFLGNFWETPERIRLTAQAPGSLEKEHKFRNAEAAFQALKFWAYARDFEDLTGDEAFSLKRVRQGFEDFTYGGKGDNWKGMLSVLESKFAPKSAMAEAILKTGDTFLLEHNSVKGRDDTWSDNNDGEGKNWLGLQLMLIRDKLAGRREWTDYVGGLLSLDTGAPLDVSKGRKWQDAVRSARDALMVKVDEIRPRAPCSRVGCGKPTYNGQPGEYCSKDCRKTICSKYGCGKPSWNGKLMEYCSKACRQADNVYWTGPSYGMSYGIGGSSYGTSYGTSYGPSYGTSYGTSGGTTGHTYGSSYGTSYGTSGASHSTSHGTSGTTYGTSYGASGVGGSSSGAHTSAAASPAICKTPGCGKPTWNGQPHQYCSKTCKEDTIGKAVGGGKANTPPAHQVVGTVVGTSAGVGTGAATGGAGAGTAAAKGAPGKKKKMFGLF